MERKKEEREWKKYELKKSSMYGTILSEYRGSGWGV